MTPEIRKVGIVGGGVIGAGWAARFVLNGIDVSIYDPDPEIERKTTAVIANARRALARLFGNALPAEGSVTFAASLADAVREADFIQESLPEREDLKIRLLAEMDAAMPAHAVIGSSTSGLLPTKLQSGMARPDRLVVGHPFNPVYLLPLVEICGGDQTSQQTKDIAAAVYTRIGMKVLHVRKEIDGFIADRLLEAVWRLPPKSTTRSGSARACAGHSWARSSSTGWRAARRACATSSTSSALRWNGRGPS